MTKGLTTTVDDADAPRVLRHEWHASESAKGRVYARAWVDGRHVYLHRFVARAPRGLLVDHANADTLDNRRENLRLATPSQNGANTRTPERIVTRYRGVSWEARRGKWRARISIGGRDVYLGSFEHERDAAHAYDRTARSAFGVFARLNFPDSVPQIEGATA